ncbi:hypothetical protein HMPREF0063_10127 [Aeromicrobium marinum DSM 15272]|uniref:GAF domain-containing protein n=1 Tax=Aeromicrobium marinum DSM 15272 TaxID=585531 RepID=E2S7X0_9ACTN|nr:hypothetical protein [Aeromicrobium marinum]EFQ84786.1 hypothetical protein HMPREF0063_10127 [Aeromicrobium marinum DSM 15272]
MDTVDPVLRAPMPSPEPGAAVERALQHGVVGLAGGPDEATTRRVERFAGHPVGTFVWTRDVEGALYLGRVTGDLRDDPAGSEVMLDHVRDCDWLPQPVPDPDVPAAVRQTFARGGRNLQQIHPGDVERLTADLWQRLAR